MVRVLDPARKYKILEGAVSCILEKGFHQTSMRDIAQAAGVSLGNLYNHFDGKQALIREIANQERAENEQFLKILNSNETPEKRLGSFIKAAGKEYSDSESVRLNTEIFSELLRDPEIAKLFTGNWGKLREAVAGVMSEAGSRPIEECLIMADQTIDMIEGLAYRRQIFKNLPYREEIKNIENIVIRFIANEQ